MSIVTRRSFVGAAVVVVAGVAGVTAEFVRHPHRHQRRTGSPSPSGSTRPPSPASTLLTRALTREQALLARLDDAATATPTLRGRLAVLRADHRAHADALSALITATGATPNPSTTTPSTSPSSAPSTAPPPAAATTTTQVAAWEKANAAAAGRDCPSAAGPAAAVLASLYACEQTHVAWLG